LCNKHRNSKCEGKVVSTGVKFEKFKKLTNDEFKKLKIDIDVKSEHICVKKGRIINGNIFYISNNELCFLN